MQRTERSFKKNGCPTLHNYNFTSYRTDHFSVKLERGGAAGCTVELVNNMYLLVLHVVQDENGYATQGPDSVQFTQYAKSLRYYLTREALPSEGNYR